MTPEDLERLLRADKTPGAAYSGKADENGLYDAGGMRWPRPAVGQCAVIMLAREDGGYDVVMSQRAAHLVHGGKWALFGGYLDVNKGEGPIEAILREVREETNKLVDLTSILPQPLLPFMDYNDRHNKACYCNGFLFVVPLAQANEIRTTLRKAIADGNFDSETANIDIVPVDRRLDANIAAKGGFGYAHEYRFLMQAVAKLDNEPTACVHPKQTGSKPGDAGPAP